MTEEPKANKLIKGVKVELGGDEYIIPPLNLEQLEEQAELLDRLGTITDLAEQRQGLLELALVALQRNYPELTLTRLKQLIDLGNIQAVSAAIMGGNGFVQGERPPGD
jgi:hypothetical protein